MKTARRITTNFLSLSIAELVSKLIQLVIFVYIARIFGKSEFGEFGFALAFSTIAVVLVDFGINTLLIREISKDKKNVNKYISNTLIIKLILSVIAFILSYLFLYFFDKNGSIITITFLMLLFIVLQSFTDLFYSVFRAFERMYYDALIKIVRMLLLLLLIFIFISRGASLTIVTSMFPITEVIVLLLSYIIYRINFAKLSLKLDLEFEKELIKKSSFFALSILFGSVLLYIDTIILENMRGSTEVGIYAAAYNLLLGITFIPLMFSNAIFPVFSRYFMKDKSLLKFAYKKSFQYMLMLGLPITAGIFMYARNIVLLIYGLEYAESIVAIKILCLFVFLRFINITSGTLLSSIDRQGARVFGQGVVAFINIVLNLILIPKYGFIGAGIATITSESFFLVTYSYFIIRENLSFGFVSTSIKPVVASIIMVGLINFIPDLLLGSIVGAISYFGILLLIKTFKKEDKELLTRIIKNN